MNDIDAAEEWLDSWVGQVNAQAQRSVELSRRVAALTGSAQGRDGTIRVTVGSAGQVDTETGRAVLHSYDSRFPGSSEEPDL